MEITGGIKIIVELIYRPHTCRLTVNIEKCPMNVLTWKRKIRILFLPIKVRRYISTVSQLDGKSGHPNLEDQSGNNLHEIAEYVSFRLGCVTSPAHGTTHYIKFFSKVSNASGAQIIGFSAKYWVWILFSAEFWVESPYHILKSVDPVQSWYVSFSLFFSAWATPTGKL